MPWAELTLRIIMHKQQKSRDQWCIHSGFKTYEQSKQKSKT